MIYRGCNLQLLSWRHLHIVDVSTSTTSVLETSVCISCKYIPGLVCIRWKIIKITGVVSFRYAFSFAYTFLQTVLVTMKERQYSWNCWFVDFLSLVRLRPSFCQSILHLRSSLYAEHLPFSQDVAIIIKFWISQFRGKLRVWVWPDVHLNNYMQHVIEAPITACCWLQELCKGL